MRMLEGSGAPVPPPSGGGGMSLEDQIRLLEGGGGDMAAPPPTAPPQPPSGAGFGFEEHLRNLVMEIPGSIAGSVIGFDGIGLASFTTDPDFQTTIADAELAGIIGAVKKAAQSLSAGNPQESYLMTDRYGFILKSIRNQFLLSLIIEAKELNWGLIRLQMNKIVPLIEQELF